MKSRDIQLDLQDSQIICCKVLAYSCDFEVARVVALHPTDDGTAEGGNYQWAFAKSLVVASPTREMSISMSNFHVWGESISMLLTIAGREKHSAAAPEKK